MSFLKAEWRKLVMINYEVNPKILEKYLPVGTDLDYFQNKCYVSVVGFMFKNTKLLGVKVPFHINFEEVNLRFYVKRKTKEGYKRGVVFIKEIVPKHAITFVANTFYNETLPMKHSWEINDENLKVVYQWKKNKKWNSIQVDAENLLNKIEENSVIEFISEHYWGYAKENDKSTTEYEVKHSKWEYNKIKEHTISINFGSNYGSDFFFLNDEKPTSVMLLEGSEISVENKKSIR